MEHKILRLTISAQFGNTVDTVYPTILWDEENTVLVDCGFIGSLPALEKELAQHGLTVKQLTGLVLTHHDHDHMGSGRCQKGKSRHKDIRFKSRSALYFRTGEAPQTKAGRGCKNAPPEQQDFGRAFCDMLSRVEPVFVDEF